MSRFADRLRRLEARRPRPPLPRPALTRDSWDRFFRVRAALVAVHLGEWDGKADAFVALEQGLLNVTSQYTKPSIDYAVMTAEFRMFGSYSNDERVRRLWMAAPQLCRAAYAALAGLLDRYPELDRTRVEPVDHPSFMGKAKGKAVQ